MGLAVLQVQQAEDRYAAAWVLLVVRVGRPQSLHRLEVPSRGCNHSPTYHVTAAEPARRQRAFVSE